MGTVEVAVRRAEGFERLYALKRLHPHLRDEDELVAMFLDEARVGGRIRHANVVSVLDVGRDADGPYFVMDYVEGRSVRDILKATSKASRSIPVQVAVRIGAQVASGLHAAHELTDGEGRPLDLVHRDVSPQNIIVGFDGTCRLTDFGIAKVYGASTQTSTGVLKGKKGYTSPEQLRLERLDRRCDIFSLGIVLFELLSGRKLYSGGPQSVMQSILYDPAPDVGVFCPDAPPALVELLFRMLAKEPEQRPSTAAEVAETLQQVLGELVAEESSITIADFVADTFPGEQDADRAKVRLALDGLEHDSRAPATSPRRRTLLAAIAIAAVSLAAGVGVTIVVVRSGDLPAADPPEVLIAGASHEPAAPNAQLASPQDAGAPEVPDAASLPTEDTVVANETSQPRPHRRRRTRATTRSPHSASGGSPSTWAWPGR